MTVTEVLYAAADLIEPEGAWTRDTMARDQGGQSVGYASPDACSWCVGGAIFKVATGSAAGAPSGLPRRDEPMIRHQLIEATSEKGRRHLTFRCGETLTIKANERMPDEVTGWSSDVTCEECRK